MHSFFSTLSIALINPSGASAYLVLLYCCRDPDNFGEIDCGVIYTGPLPLIRKSPMQETRAEKQKKTWEIGEESGAVMLKLVWNARNMLK